MPIRRRTDTQAETHKDTAPTDSPTPTGGQSRGEGGAEQQGSNNSSGQVLLESTPNPLVPTNSSLANSSSARPTVATTSSAIEVRTDNDYDHDYILNQSLDEWFDRLGGTVPNPTVTSQPPPVNHNYITPYSGNYYPQRQGGSWNLPPSPYMRHAPYPSVPRPQATAVVEPKYPDGSSCGFRLTIYMEPI